MLQNICTNYYLLLLLLNYSLIDLISCKVVHFEHDDDLLNNVDVLMDNDLLITEEEERRLIFPGTKWCGSGDVAENYDDLGASAETDVCCRQHDFCDDLLPAGQTKHNLTNYAFYTRLNCKCDVTFYDCLKTANTKTSKSVGLLYFSALGTQCFMYDYPIVRCIKYHRFLKNRCIQYELDEHSEKIWEWFDVPPF